MSTLSPDVGETQDAVSRRAFLSWGLLGLGAVAGVLRAKKTEAALPPISEARRREFARHIVSGVAGRETFREHPVEGRPGHTSRYCSLDVTIREIEKGAGLKPGGRITVHYWQPGKRPRGWVGGVSQHRVPAPGDLARFYFTEEKSGEFRLLVPNGATIITRAADRPRIS